MSAVPKLRFPEFDGEWKKILLKNIAKIYDGTHQTPKYVESGIPFFSVEHITSGNFEKTRFIAEEVYEKECRRVKIEQGDVLMTRIGDIGSVKYIDWTPKASFYVSLALLKFSKELSSNYLSHYMRTAFFQAEIWRRTIHVAFPKKINLGEIGACYVALPSLPEQQKIASFLSSVDKKIDLLRQKKDALELYKKGLMQKIFSQEIRFKQDDGSDFPEWEEVALGDVAKVTTGTGNREDSQEAGQYIFFDRSTDMRWSDRYEFDQEAIIVAGEGKSFPPRYFVGKFGLHQRAYAIYDFKEASAKFLFYMVYLRRNFFLKMSVGSTMPSLRMNAFTEFPISLPCPPEQQKIASFLSAIDTKIQNTSSQIEQMETFKKGLLQQMFV